MSYVFAWERIQQRWHIMLVSQTKSDENGIVMHYVYFALLSSHLMACCLHEIKLMCATAHVFGSLYD